MQFLLGLVAGLIIGWIVEWIIDWQYWCAEQDDELLQTQEQDKDLRAELDRARLEIVSLRNKLERQDDLPLTRGGAGITDGITDGTASDVAAGEDAPDKLQRIKGIGPVFAQRLNEAGVYTFAQLAATPPDTIVEAVQAQEWQAVDPASWIAAARELAAHTDKGG